MNPYFTITEWKLCSRCVTCTRSLSSTQGMLHVYIKDRLTIDRDKQLVTRDGQYLHLTRTELSLLLQLATNPGNVCTRRQLLRQTWGSEYVEHTHYLRIYMGQLREKLEPNPADPTIILTETGIGYRLAEPDQ